MSQLVSNIFISGQFNYLLFFICINCDVFSILFFSQFGCPLYYALLSLLLLTWLFALWSVDLFGGDRTSFTPAPPVHPTVF